jgi:3-oxoacyl-[acyl-carrier protein] reductase
MHENIKKVALVTGASSGIGQASAIRIARDHFFVLVHFNKNRDGAEKTVDAIVKAGGQAEAIGFDVRQSQAIDSVLNDWFANHPNLSWEILVNNAGLHIDNLAGIMSDEAFEDVLKTNTFGAFYLMRSAVRKMLRNRCGCIVNVASLSGQIGNVGQVNYAASKAALIAMTKTLAMEVGPRGIRVNAVSPGIIETEMVTSIPNLDQIKNRIPLQRFGRAEEVASVIAFLISQDASYITGHTLSVNGGLLPT